LILLTCLIRLRVTARILDLAMPRDEFLMLPILGTTLTATTWLGSVSNDLRSADLGESVLLASTPLLLLGHVRDLWHLGAARGTSLDQFVDIFL
jgi:hypothetical protein